MKNLFNATINNETKVVHTTKGSHLYKLKTRSFLGLILLSGAFLLAACNKQDDIKPNNMTQSVKPEEANVNTDTTGLSSKTLEQLKEAREATVKYRDINNAIADGYVDIHVVMQNMGYHFEKASLVDSVFNVRKPELLVYNKRTDGGFNLVAVEYAVPLDQSINAPKGFAGKQDVWDHNTTFGLWTLHAWVWKDNPDGVFSPMNPDVHVR
jgi:hypothetical protein